MPQAVSPLHSRDVELCARMSRAGEGLGVRDKGRETDQLAWAGPLGVRVDRVQ